MPSRSRQEMKAWREMLKADLASNVTSLTGAGYQLEYLFAAPERKWRSDVAWPEVKVALEIDGGTWINGRHNRPSSMPAEMDKGNGYAERGWLVFHVLWEWVEDPIMRANTEGMIAKAIAERLQSKKIPQP